MAMKQINMPQSLKSILNHSSLKLHKAINEFKRKEAHKIILNNKINILKHKCQTKRKKAKLIEFSISKMNQLKQEIKRNKEEKTECLSLEKEYKMEKIQRQKSLRNITKENMRIVRNMIAKEKNEEYLKIKQNQRENQFRITQNMLRSLHEKRQRSLEIKLKEQQMRMSRTIFMQKKRLKTLKNSQAELKPLEQVTKITDKYIEHMQMLQRQMINKFNKTTEILSKSMIKQRNMLR